MGETVGDAPPVTKAKPTILVPPRGLLFANGSGPGFSPGPMTLVSSLFPEQGLFSFSQLLAGTMSSPPTAAQPQPQSFSPLFMVPPPGMNLTGFLNSPGYLSPLQSPFGMSHQQALAHVTAQAALSQSFKQMQAEFYHSSSTHPSDPSANHSLDTLTQNPTSNHLSSEPDSSKSEPISETSPSDKSPADKPANDGYNWRKYGQKQVKASECPRSYYKCSNLSCPVKKKVGRALDGRVTEVTYKGEHNHDVPKHNKRAKDSCASDKTNVALQDRIEIDGLKEAINSDNNDKEGSATNVDKCDEDEPIAKRRSVDIVPASSHQAVSESKIVLQTRSEVDLLDDGYKWRKYGQKVVKGNPYPRSYYRCTYAGCNVRKHVERASVDPKAVITTYEGKHNHDIPTGRHVGAQQLKAQKKMASKNSSIKEEINRGDDKDNNIPVTLQLKE